MTEPTSHTLTVPGAVLHYDIRNPQASPERPLLLIASPMGADGFVQLAGYFPDRTVVTYDPRSAGRSQRTDGSLVTIPEEHADDLHRLLATLGGETADILASSGGAVNALVLAAKHPEQVRTLVAHEPPAASALPDSKVALAAANDIHDTYVARGFGPAMAKFILLASYKGPLPADYLDQPDPDPAAFGMPAGDDGSRDHPLVGQNMPSCLEYEHDYDALRTGPARVVLGIGEDSADEIAGRAAAAVAAHLGTDPVIFPGGHAGFLDGQYGQQGKPAEFAEVLRQTLS